MHKTSPIDRTKQRTTFHKVYNLIFLIRLDSSSDISAIALDKETISSVKAICSSLAADTPSAFAANS